MSYLVCVYFDVGLEVLGDEREYYVYSDEDWETIIKERAETEKRYRVVVDDVTKKLTEAMDKEVLDAGGNGP